MQSPWRAGFSPRGASAPLLAAILLAGCLHAADDWPQFRGNPQLTGVATSAVPGTLKLLWTYEAGDGIQSSAAIADGAVYVGVESADLLAIDLATGKLRWKYRAQDGIDESSPLVHDGVVYVGDIAGTLHAVRAADGKALWTFKTESEIRSSPVISGDRVFIGSYDGNLYCLSVKDGKVLWKFTTSSYVHATPAIAGGLIYIAGCDEIFRGLRIADGKEMFHSIPADTPARRLRSRVSGRSLAPSTTTWRARISAASESPGDTKTPRGSFRSILPRPWRATAWWWAGATRWCTASTPKPERRLDVRHARARGFVAGHRGRARLRGVQRRPVLCAGSCDWEKSMGVRGRRAALRFARDCRRAHRDWLAGRQTVLLRSVTR
jgi:hypothetical protein